MEVGKEELCHPGGADQPRRGPCRRCVPGDGQLRPQRRHPTADLAGGATRVWKAVEELHYTPDHHARMLKTKESDIVLIVMVGATPGPGLVQMIDNLTRRVAAAGYTPLIDFTGTPSPTAFSRACERIQPVAVVAPGPLLSPRIAKLLELNGTRCVLAVGDGPGKSIARLRYSQESVGEAATTWLNGDAGGCLSSCQTTRDWPTSPPNGSTGSDGYSMSDVRIGHVPMDLDAARDPILAACTASTSPTPCSSTTTSTH